MQGVRARKKCTLSFCLQRHHKNIVVPGYAIPRRQYYYEQCTHTAEPVGAGRMDVSEDSGSQASLYDSRVSSLISIGEVSCSFAIVISRSSLLSSITCVVAGLDARRRHLGKARAHARDSFQVWRDLLSLAEWETQRGIQPDTERGCEQRVDGGISDEFFHQDCHLGLSAVVLTCFQGQSDD